MLNKKTKRLASGPNFAVLTTLMPDGTPQAQVMWVDCDDDHILINTEVHRRKFANITRDPRATVTVIDSEDGYSYSEVRGTVVETIRGDVARKHIDDLSHKYLGKPFEFKVESERVILKIRPTREVLY